jgi:hypothetical protein
VVPSPELVLIDFRYHIVSIAAVFLALGIGVATGAAVLDRVTVGQLENQLNTLRDQLNDHRAEVTELRALRTRSSEMIDGLAERVVEGSLEGTSLVLASMGTEEEWHSDVREALVGAGGVVAGSVVLSELWMLEEGEQIEELREILNIEQETDEPDGGGVPAEAGVMLGGLLGGPLSSPVLVSLEEAGFLNLVPGEETLEAQRVVVVLASTEGNALLPVMEGASEETPTLAVAPSLEELGELEELRSEGPASFLLSTFDSAATDPSGVGMVLALEAALEGRGGHFGNGEGLDYAPSAS